MVKDVERWKDVVRRPSPWLERLVLISSFIPPGSRVVDVGAGHQDLRRLLPDGCTYTAIDLVPGPDDTIVVDLDALGQPDDWPLADVAVLSGVLEYVSDPIATLDFIGGLAPTVLFSYSHEPDPFARKRNGWVNCIEPNGFPRCEPVAEWRGQTIYERW